jgi:chromosome segregation ATPase
VTPAGEKLEQHLTQAINELKPPQQEGEKAMRGMQRLAHLTENLTKQLDAKADEVADRIERAHERGQAAIGRFSEHATQIEQTADEIEKALGQITNGPPTSGSESSEPSQPA